MTAAAPSVTFVVPAYNAAATLRRTAESLIAQTLPKWEAIIVDDGSRDATGRIGSALASADPRFRLLSQTNTGPSGARNRGLAEARAERVVFVDSDDWLMPDFLERLLPLAHSPLSLPYCAVQRVLPSGRLCPSDFCAQLERDPFSVLLHRCEPAIHCVVAHAGLIRSVGGFDAELQCCEDWDLWLRLVRAGCSFVGVDKPLALYRMRPGSLSTRDDVGNRAASIVMRRARGVDPRLPPDAPFRAPVMQETERSEREHALAHELRLVAAGSQPSTGWLRPHAAAWQEVAIFDPEAIAHFAMQEMPAELGFSVDDATVSRVIEAMGPIAPDAAKRFADGFDLYRAKRGQGVFGRYRSITLDGGAIPEALEPAAGIDALVVRLEDREGEPRLLMLPFLERVARTEIVAALLSSLPVTLLIRHYTAHRSPRFWLHGSWSLVRGLAAAPRAFAGNARAQVARAMRAGTAAALRGASPREPLPTPRPVDVPIVLIPKVIANDSALLEETIGAAQLDALIACLAGEGYTSVCLERILTLQRSARYADLKPFAAVFLDVQTAATFLQPSPGIRPLQSADVLLSPEEIDAILEGLSSERALPHVKLRYGLRMEALAEGCEAALSQARELLSRLRMLNGDDGPVAALSHRQGLDDAILQKAGFVPILSPAGAPLRLSACGSVFPAIDCSGAEGLGNVIECLRAA